MCGQFWRAEARLAAPDAVRLVPVNLKIRKRTKSVAPLWAIEVKYL